jgi:aspartate aminotransferase
LDKAGIPYSEPQGAFYLFCQVPRSKKAESPQPGGPVASETAQGDDIAFVNHLKNHLILGVPGSGFGAPGFFRLAYCVDEGIINASEDAFCRAVETWNGTGV